MGNYPIASSSAGDDSNQILLTRAIPTGSHLPVRPRIRSTPAGLGLSRIRSAGCTRGYYCLSPSGLCTRSDLACDIWQSRSCLFNPCRVECSAFTFRKLHLRLLLFKPFSLIYPAYMFKLFRLIYPATCLRPSGLYTRPTCLSPSGLHTRLTCLSLAGLFICSGLSRDLSWRSAHHPITSNIQFLFPNCLFNVV